MRWQKENLKKSSSESFKT